MRAVLGLVCTLFHGLIHINGVACCSRPNHEINPLIELYRTEFWLTVMEQGSAVKMFSVKAVSLFITICWGAEGCIAEGLH